MSPEHSDLHAELEERLRFETLLADLSSKFVNLPAGKVDREIMDAERRICELLGLDVSGLWQWSNEAPDSLTLTHLYGTVEARVPEPMNASEYFPWYQQQMLAGRIIAFSSLEELPAEAARDREVLRHFGIRSNLTIPLSLGGEPPIGALSFNTTGAERDWPDTLVKRLQLVAQVFTNALARRRADLTVREREERLSLATSSAEVGLWVLDYRTRIFWATEKARAIFGYSPDEVVSMERLEASVHPDDWDLVRGAIERSARAGEPVNLEYRIMLPGEGGVRWIASRGRPYLKSTSEPERLMGISIDVTERKRAEEAFRVSQARLEAATDLAGLAFYEVDFGDRTVFVDDLFRDIGGFPPESLQSPKAVEFWLEHVHPEDRQRLLDQREALLDGRLERVNIEYRYLHPAQGEKWIHQEARVTRRDASGHKVKTFGVVRDITQEKRAELEARELRDNLAHLTRVSTLGALSGSLAHELNQPLGIILSNAQAAQELLAQEPPDLAEVQSILSDIVAADRRAGEVIERMRAMLKRGQASLQPLQLNQVIEEVLYLMRADLIGRGVTVVCELVPDLPLIAGDRVQLQQLVLNLVLNAAEAVAANTPEARRLHLQTTLYQSRVCASVRDEGGGLPAEVERLFEPFYTTKVRGLGMGLAICRSIAAAHGGRLWAESHSERGAVFHFEVPVASGE